MLLLLDAFITFPGHGPSPLCSASSSGLGEVVGSPHCSGQLAFLISVSYAASVVQTGWFPGQARVKTQSLTAVQTTIKCLHWDSLGETSALMTTMVHTCKPLVHLSPTFVSCMFQLESLPEPGWSLADLGC